MTKQEILSASLLDIVFENRNKDYGAYALRRYYPNRMLMALGISTSTILLFVLLQFIKKDNESISATETDSGYIIRSVIPPAPILPDPPPKASVAPRVASTAFVSRIVIQPDDRLTKPVPSQSDIQGTQISDKNIAGPPATQVVNTSGQGDLPFATVSTIPAADFAPIEQDPEFPGGQEALKRFLGTNLSTPTDLEPGAMMTVQLRFLVGKDGSVSELEIVKSGGKEFDREVIRVCKRMPRWKPAIQNGRNVSVSFVLPVTFIGVEQ